MIRIVPVLLLALAACGEPQAPAPAPKARPALSVAPAKAQPALAPVEVSVPHIQDAPRADPNRALALRVMRALEEEGKVHAAAIDVTVAGGVVTLWGTAATADERARAARIAHRVIGVTTVQNRIAVVSGS